MEITAEKYKEEHGKFRATVQEYVRRRSRDKEINDLAIKILDDILETSKTNEDVKDKSFRYFAGDESVSTVQLRDMCFAAGYDYWAEPRNTEEQLNLVNAINKLDTCIIYHRDPELFDINRFMDIDYEP